MTANTAYNCIYIAPYILLVTIHLFQFQYVVNGTVINSYYRELSIEVLLSILDVCMV